MNVMYQCALIVLVTCLVCLLHTLVLVPHSSFCKRCQVLNLGMVFVRADLYQWWPLCDGKYNIYCMWACVFYLYSFSLSSIIIYSLTLLKFYYVTTNVNTNYLTWHKWIPQAENWYCNNVNVCSIKVGFIFEDNPLTLKNGDLVKFIGQVLESQDFDSTFSKLKFDS